MQSTKPKTKILTSSAVSASSIGARGNNSRPLTTGPAAEMTKKGLDSYDIGREGRPAFLEQASAPNARITLMADQTAVLFNMPDGIALSRPTSPSSAVQAALGSSWILIYPKKYSIEYDYEEDGTTKTDTNARATLYAPSIRNCLDTSHKAA